MLSFKEFYALDESRNPFIRKSKSLKPKSDPSHKLKQKIKIPGKIYKKDLLKPKRYQVNRWGQLVKVRNG